MRKLTFFALLFVILFLGACSDSNPVAPSENAPHPTGWLAVHADKPTVSAGYTECKGCHGINLEGNGKADSCYECHSFNNAPPFSTHPANWTEPYNDHRAFGALNGFNDCLPCHGTDLHGNGTAPSCFSSSSNDMTCHATGPREVPHALDDSFLNSANHGPMAKADLIVCQSCHGEAGSAGSNPRFNVGIFSAGGHGCEGCHEANTAHPTDWAGPNNTFHYSAKNIPTACTLCHGTALNGVDGVGRNCLECHSEVESFTLDCISCHGYPPIGEADVASSTGVDHRALNNIPYVFHTDCRFCHGVREAAETGHFDASSNYKLFDKTTDTIGEHWNGKINLNLIALPVVNNNSIGCTVCHANDSAHQMTRSGLPAALILMDYSD